MTTRTEIIEHPRSTNKAIHNYNRLCEKYNRYLDMVYALVDGNLEKSDIPYETLEMWARYVETGEEGHEK